MNRPSGPASSAAHARMLGALLTAVATGLRPVRSVQIAGESRMADFALWAAAVEPACPWPGPRFLRVYAADQPGRSRSLAGGRFAGR